MNTVSFVLLFFIVVTALTLFVISQDFEDEYIAPNVPNAFFLENFNEDAFENDRWLPSKDPRFNGKC